MKKQEKRKKIYAGTIVLFVQKNDISAKVPVHSQEVLKKSLLNKCYMKISDVKYNKDIDRKEG